MYIFKVSEKLLDVLVQNKDADQILQVDNLFAKYFVVSAAGMHNEMTCTKTQIATAKHDVLAAKLMSESGNYEHKYTGIKNNTYGLKFNFLKFVDPLIRIKKSPIIVNTTEISENIPALQIVLKTTKHDEHTEFFSCSFAIDEVFYKKITEHDKKYSNIVILLTAALFLSVILTYAVSPVIFIPIATILSFYTINDIAQILYGIKFEALPTLEPCVDHSKFITSTLSFLKNKQNVSFDVTDSELLTYEGQSISASEHGFSN